MSSMEVFKFAQNMTDAVICLREGGHHLQGVMLTYVAIEQMAWLSVEPLRTNGDVFKKWVNTYMLHNAPLPCTAAELWEARNGTLHMGTAESAANRNSDKIRKVLYFYGHSIAPSSDSIEHVFLRAEDLIQSFLIGVTWFLDDLESDQGKMAIATSKLGSMLAQRQQ